MQIEISTCGIIYPTVGRKVIVNRFPGMNDIIDVSKKGRGKYQPYATMKNYFESLLIPGFKMLPKFEKANIEIGWYEPNSKRDIDNISAATKFIMDALVKANVIHDDSQKFVKSIRHNFYVDKKNPRIILNIEEVL